jgi:hypothetical protein
VSKIKSKLRRLAHPIELIVFIAIVGLIAGIVQSSYAGAQQQRDTQPAKPASGFLSWIRAEASLRGTWIHWRQTGSTFSVTSPDPANGKTIIGDIWEKIGSDDTPVLYHGWFTYEDGTFRQEVFYSDTDAITVVGSEEKSLYPPTAVATLDSDWCVQHWPVDQQSLVKRTPQFVDEKAVEPAGFKVTSGPPTRPAPANAPLAIPTSKVYSVPPTLHIWTQQSKGQSGLAASTTSISVDGQGRIMFNEWRSLDDQGKIATDTWIAQGALEVYSPAAAIPGKVGAPPTVPSAFARWVNENVVRSRA